MPSYYSIDPLPLKPLFGGSFRALSPEELKERFASHARETTFSLTALGLSKGLSELEFAEAVAARQFRGFVATEAPDEPSSEVVLTVSTIVGIALVSVWSESPVDAQAIAEDTLVLAEAIFAANAHCTRVVSTFVLPLPDILEDTLSGWGFERVGRPCDDQGTLTWGIARDVADMVLQSLR